MPAGLDEAAGVLDQVGDGLAQAVGVAQHVGRLARDARVRLAIVQDGGQRVDHAVRQIVQVHALHGLGDGGTFYALQGQQVVRQAAEALAFVHDDAAELLMQRGRQVGVGEHLGVAADGRQRRAQLMRDVADELVLAALLDGKVMLLLGGGLHEALEVAGQQVGLVHAAVGLERDGRAAAERCHLLRQVAKRFGQEMADKQADAEDDHADRDKDQQDRYGGVVHEHAHDGRDHRSEQAEQRGQEREICLQPFYSLNLYP